MRFLMFRKLIIITIYLSVFTLTGAEQLLKNGDFSVLNEENLPSGWNFRGSRENENIAKKNDAGINFLKITVKKAKTTQGFIITNALKIKKNTEYVLSGDIKSSIANMAFLQVKLYKNKKEIKRYSSKRSKKYWTRSTLKFNNADSDYIKILLRFYQIEKNINQSTCFKNIKLLEVPNIKNTTLTAIPLFQTCSLYLNGKKIPEKNNVWFRKQGAIQWHKGFPLVKSVDHKQLKGSIIRLKENTNYEAKVITKAGEFKTKFTTWSSSPPIKQTIILNENNFNKYLNISKSGTKNGWIKYIAAKNFILRGKKDKTAVINISGVKYIILEGLTIQGGGKHGINISHAENIRVVNCDISGWGRIGVQRFDKDGKYYMGNERRSVNYDAAVNIDRSKNIVVERCYAHDPNGKANSWTFSHPAGPNAIAIRSLGSTVLRFNDFIGSDTHRWNDCVEGYGNGKIDGGFYRDASIYGNMFAFGNDDGIELDGGQMNIRLFYNKIEGFLCGVSTAPCLLGPSYIFNNLIVNLGDEYNTSNFAFKNIYSSCGNGRIFFFNNTVYTKRNGFSSYNSRDKIPDDLQKGMSRNNILYCSGNHIAANLFKHKSDFDYDLLYANNSKLIDRKIFEKYNVEKNAIIGKNPKLKNISSGDFSLKSDSPAIECGAIISGFSEGINGNSPDMGAFDANTEFILPYRPIPVYIDKNQFNFVKSNSKKLLALIKGETFNMGFKIMKNKSSKWLSIKPEAGRFKSGDKKIFTVKVNSAKMLKSGINKAVFLIRLDNGFSRPVTVYAQNPQTLKKIKIKGAHVYIEAENPSKNTEFKIKNDKDAFGQYLYIQADGTRNLGDKKVVYKVNIPENGNYYILIRVKGEHPLGSHDSIFMAVNSESFFTIPLQCSTKWQWNIAADSKKRFTPYPLKRGINIIRFSPRESIDLDQILVAKNPWKLFSHSHHIVNKNW